MKKRSEEPGEEIELLEVIHVVHLIDIVMFEKACLSGDKLELVLDSIKVN